MIEFEIDLLPPSMNSMYRVFNGRSILSKKVRDFKLFLSKKIPKNLINYLSLNYDYYDVEIKFSMPNIYRKSDGKISLVSGDIDNMCKCLIDVIFTESNENDSKICKLIVSKTHGEKEKTRVIIQGHFLNMC